MINQPVTQIVRASLFNNNHVGPLSDNRLLNRFLSSDEAIQVRRRFGDYPMMSVSGDEGNSFGPGDLIVLKRYDPVTDEKGVVLVEYTERMREFVALYEVERLIEDYVLVLEPSSWGYQNPATMLYVGIDADVLIQAPRKEDYEFLEELDCNIRPLEIGAGDWVDPQQFRPPGVEERKYDVVMVAQWSPVKRHYELFDALRTAREEYSRDLKTLLVGHRSEWDKSVIASLAKKYGVYDLVDVLQSIPYEEVPVALSSGRIHVLTSRSEGANRAIYEAMFCDTPVIVPDDHCGVRLEDIVPPVGLQYGDGGLCDAIIEVLDNYSRYGPREWAEERTGYVNTTKRLNEELRILAEERGLKWTDGVVEKVNNFNCSYANGEDAERMAREYQRILEYTR